MSEDQGLYRIIRVFTRSGTKRVIKTNLTLEQAQQHCRDPETRSATCTRRVNVQRTERLGEWVDRYEAHRR